MKVSHKQKKVGWAIFEKGYLIGFDNKITPIVNRRYSNNYRIIQVDYSRRFVVVERIW